MKTLFKNLMVSMTLAFTCGIATMAQSIILQGDVNKDSKVDVADIATVISIMGGNQTEILDNTPGGVKVIDLKLPSGTKWANRNIGANEDKDGGYYFAWGDIEKAAKDDSRTFNWGNYKWMSEGENTWVKINKYQVCDGMTSGCWYDENGIFDDKNNKAVLFLEDDAANYSWKGYWRMPTYEDFAELTTYCTSKWINDGDKIGREFTSKINGASVFFPAAGCRNNASLERNGVYGYYWSATVYPTYTPNAYNLYISSGNVRTNDSPRYYGYSIRPVRKD